MSIEITDIISPSTGYRSLEESTVTQDELYATGIPERDFLRFHTSLGKPWATHDYYVEHFRKTLLAANIGYFYRDWNLTGPYMLAPPSFSKFQPKRTWTVLNAQKALLQPLYAHHPKPKSLPADICKAIEANILKTPEVQTAAVKFFELRLRQEKDPDMIPSDEEFVYGHRWAELLAQAFTSLNRFLVRKGEDGNTIQVTREELLHFLQTTPLIPPPPPTTEAAAAAAGTTTYRSYRTIYYPRFT